MITINTKYDSSDLLFSIPVHEKQEIVNNTIENIFNFNPNCKIILHINKNFSTFDSSLSKYHNLYFHSTNYDYKPGEDLLIYHILNFHYCIQHNIDFEYFIICASNELYIKKNAVNYIKEYKNGIQIITDNTHDWHNFNKNINTQEPILQLFDLVNHNTFCGGQTEGQFFQKNIFQKIVDYYKIITHNFSFQFNFEAEEIIPQIIFCSLNLNHGDPLTLQNYTNKLKFTKPFIQNLINNTLIPDNKIKSQLISPHTNKSSEHIYSIKRVNRDFNEIRNFLSQKGIILNKNNYNFNTYYYSNNSSLIFNHQFEINFTKMCSGFKDFQWFGYFLKKGIYQIEFEFKTNTFINQYSKCGLKIHQPYNYVISNFFSNYSEEFKKVTINLINHHDQNIIFIFDDFEEKINFQIKNLKINTMNLINNNLKKKNIIIILFKNSNKNFKNYENFKYYLFDIFKKIYNIYYIVILKNDISQSQEKYIYANFLPNYLYHEENIDFRSILNCLNDFLTLYPIIFDFIFISNLHLHFIQPINNNNFIINKINFISYIHQNNIVDLCYNLCIIPFDVFQKIKNYKHNNILDYLNSEYIDYHLFIDDFYTACNNIIEYKPISYDIKKNGFLFENNFIPYVTYFNKHCYFQHLQNNKYYFYKKNTFKYEEFIWCGYNLKFIDENINTIPLLITFDFKLNTPFIIQPNVGLKTHYPTYFYNDFFNKLTLHTFCPIQLNINIQKKNQLIIFNFDHYHSEIEFEIKNFKIFYNNN